MNEMDSFDINGSFMCETEDLSEIEAYRKYFFEQLKPGVIIPPSKFQAWLHPTLKLNYTKQAPGYPDGWLQMK